ncbi:MAG: Ig-like domain-containing protein [Bacteroidales bacterium]
MNSRYIYILILIVVSLSLTGSCANTTTPPAGGDKDTIPPILIKTLPDSGAVNFPVKEGTIELKFDEYITLKEPQKYIYLSPPVEKKVEPKIRGKSIFVTFPSNLDSSVTYTLNFGKSIVDNNESNQFYSYTFPFSTGSYLDSLMCSGTVLNATTLLPAENITIAFYKELSDSVIFKEKPSAFSKSDKFGYFVVRNIGKGPYKVYAFSDENNNNLYDPDNEKIAFSDTLFIPDVVLRDSLKELLFVEEKDTLAALGRPSLLSLYLFKEDPAKQFIKESKRVHPRMAYIKFSTPNAKVISVGFREVDSLSLLKEMSIKRDSLVLWVTDTSMVKMPDTLHLTVKYLKTDSLGKLAPFTEKFSLAAPKPKKRDDNNENDKNKTLKEKEKRSDLLEFEIVADPALLEQEGFLLNFPNPLVRFEKDSVNLNFKTPKGEKGKLTFFTIYDTIFSRFVRLRPQGRLLPGYEYSLDVKRRAFMDIYKHTNDSIVKSASLPQDERMSKLILDATNVNGSYIVELTNITRDKIFRSYKINADSKLEFPYLQPGKYSVKIVQDMNGNGIIDTGNVIEKIQPEKVRLFKLSNGSAILIIPESSEVTQSINVNNIFDEKK